jgi:hypothetical protein
MHKVTSSGRHSYLNYILHCFHQFKIGLSTIINNLYRWRTQCHQQQGNTYFCSYYRQSHIRLTQYSIYINDPKLNMNLHKIVVDKCINTWKTKTKLSNICNTYLRPYIQKRLWKYDNLLRIQTYFKSSLWKKGSLYDVISTELL